MFQFDISGEIKSTETPKCVYNIVTGLHDRAALIGKSLYRVFSKKFNPLMYICAHSDGPREKTFNASIQNLRKI